MLVYVVDLKPMRSFLFFLCLLIGSGKLFAQSTPEQIMDKFFQEMVTEKPDKVIDDFYAHMPWLANIKDEIAKLKTNFKSLPDYFGKFCGQALITKKEIGGGALVLYTYLVKYERQPVRFVFKFYKPKDSWIAYGFSYDMNLDEELDQSVKLQNLK